MKENIKNGKGITLVSLVVTIIILIILAGVSINMTLGEGGIITIAKKAKENIELAQIEEQEKLNELYSQLEKNEGITGGEIDYDIIAKLNNFKKQIADYIEEAGGEKPDYTADAITFGEKIKGIVKEVTKNATATEEDILEGKTAWVNGKLVLGSLKNNNSSIIDSYYKENSNTNTTPSININRNITLPKKGTYYLNVNIVLAGTNQSRGILYIRRTVSLKSGTATITQDSSNKSLYTIETTDDNCVINVSGSASGATITDTRITGLASILCFK